METSKETLPDLQSQDIAKTIIPDTSLDKIFSIYLMFFDVLEKHNIADTDFEKFLYDFMRKNNISESDINWVEFKNNKIIIYTKSTESYTFDFQEFLDFYRNEKFWDFDIEEAEIQNKIIHLAMESIFIENTKIFDELDENDRVNIWKISKNLKSKKLKPIKWKSIDETIELLKIYEWKNLIELKELLEASNTKLLEYYKEYYKTKKSLELLEKQVRIYAWVWDIYEWWARLLSTNSQEIDLLTTEIIDKKTVPELIEYIRITNNTISRNLKVFDMAKANNLWLIRNLVEKTFEKMKKEKSSQREFINFIRVITWRNLTSDDWKEKQFAVTKVSDIPLGFYGTETEYVHENLVNVKSEFKQTDIANKALIYIMYNSSIIEKTKEKMKNKFSLEDKIFTKDEKEKITEVNEVFDKSLKQLKEIWVNTDNLLENMWISNLRWKKISELWFDEMLKVWVLFRVAKKIKDNLSNLKWKSPDEIISFLNTKNNEALSEAYKSLNKSFFSNFDKGLSWTSSIDLGLEKEEAEIFDLYGEINGKWLFNLADENWFSKNFLNLSTWVVLSVWVLTAAIVLSPAVMAAWWAWLLLAWAEIWLTTTIASQLMSDKWYDTLEEAAWWIWTQAWVDIVSSALFTAWSWWIIWKTWWKAFSETLQNELKTWQLTQKTQEKLWNILVEWTRDLAKWNKFIHWRLWKPKVQITVNELEKLKNAWFSWELSEKSIEFLWKYSAVNWNIWNLFDMWIWLWDWITSSIVWQMLELGFVDKKFVENHFNPDLWETFLSVKELKSKSNEHRQEIEKTIANDVNLKEIYYQLSEQDKNDISLYYTILYKKLFV